MFFILSIIRQKFKFSIADLSEIVVTSEYIGKTCNLIKLVDHCSFPLYHLALYTFSLPSQLTFTSYSYLVQWECNWHFGLDSCFCCVGPFYPFQKNQRLYIFPLATETDYHKLHGFTHIYSLTVLGGHKSEMKV